MPLPWTGCLLARPGWALSRPRSPTRIAARLPARKPDNDGLVVVASRSHSTPDTEAFIAANKVAKLTNAGSSMKFCLLAAGEADLYPRFGPTMEWDTAAGHAVLSAAGGFVEEISGAPLNYGKRGLPQPQFCRLYSRNNVQAPLPSMSNPRAFMLTHLQRLEAESIHIIREVAAEAENPVMLYSIGKDSAVMLHLAMKAFYPALPPFPLDACRYQVEVSRNDHVSR